MIRKIRLSYHNSVFIDGIQLLKYQKFHDISKFTNYLELLYIIELMGGQFS